MIQNKSSSLAMKILLPHDHKFTINNRITIKILELEIIVKS